MSISRSPNGHASQALEQPSLQRLAGPFPLYHCTLANGLQVFLSVSTLKPEAHARVVVRVGSQDDPPDAGGLAHLLEHMLFKGTDRLGTLDYEAERPHLQRLGELIEQRLHAASDRERERLERAVAAESAAAARFAIANELERLYRAIGASRLNAETSQDATVYSVTIPSNRLEHWALIEAERFRNPVFRLLVTELQAIEQERAKSHDEKRYALFRPALARLFGDHPSVRDTLGDGELARLASLRNLQRFYHSHYVAGSMAVVISGDIDPQEAAAVVARRFSSLASGAAPARPEPAAVSCTGEQTITLSAPLEEMVMIVFPTVRPGHPDEQALRVADTILDSWQHGLLHCDLAHRVGSLRVVRRDCILEVLHGSPGAGRSLEQTRQHLLEQLRRLAAGDFPGGMVAAAIAEIRRTEKRAAEDNESRADAICDCFVNELSWAERTAVLDGLSRVDKAEVQRVACQYLGERRVVCLRRHLPEVGGSRGGSHEPGGSRTDGEVLAQGAQPSAPEGMQSELARLVLQLEAPAIRPVHVDFTRDLSRQMLGDNVELVCVPNPVNDLFTLEMVFERGRYHDRLLPLAAGLLQESGLKGLSCLELRSTFYEMGASVSISVQDTRTRLGLDGPDECFARATALLIDWIRGLEPCPQDLERLVAAEIERRRQARSDLRTRERALAEYSRLGARSRFINRLSEAELRTMQPSVVRASWMQLTRSRPRIGYVGARPPQQVAELLGELLPAPRGEQGSAERPLAIDYGAPVVHLHHFASNQMRARIQIPSTLADPLQLPYVQLYNEYLSGSAGSLISQQLRELRGLVYSARASYLAGADRRAQDIMAAGLGCRPDRTPQALALMRDLVYSPPLREQRFAEARAALIERYRISRVPFRRMLPVLRSWEDAGFVGIDPRRTHLPVIEEMTIDAVDWIPRQRLAGRHMIVSLIGDTARVDCSELEHLGAVEHVGVEELFSRVDSE